MTAADSYGELLRLKLPVITTQEAAARLRLSVSRASHLLRALEEAGLTRRLRHGLWALIPDVEPFVVAPYLTAPYPAYVSFWSALARHGMIGQIPRQIFVASTHQTRRVDTTVGSYSIHQLTPDLFDGYNGSGQTGYLADPEKALFDTIYLLSARGGQIFLPELSVPKALSEKRLRAWVNRIARPRLRTLVSRSLQDRLRNASKS